MLPKRLLMILTSLMLALLSVLVLTLAAQAVGPWYVSPTGHDGNNCLSPLTACQTISAAISKASSGDTIIIAAGTYTENLVITKSLILQGAGADVTIVDGNAAGRVFSVTASIEVMMVDLTITNGYAIEGGGIYNDGILTLNNCIITDNTARGIDGDDNSYHGTHAYGGGIYNTGILTLTNCTISSNIARGGDGYDSSSNWGGSADAGWGGGIYNQGTSTLKNCAIINNIAIGGNGGDSSSSSEGWGGSAIGGGIYSRGTLVLNNCTINNNTAIGGMSGHGSQDLPDGTGHGGGIASDNTSTLTITDNTISGNIASFSGGGIDCHCRPATIINSTIRANEVGSYGGGIAARNSTVIITGSIISANNSTNHGGGIYQMTNSTSTVMLNNSTVSGNNAHYGGGIFTGNTTGSSTVTLNHSTIGSNIALNQGGGVYRKAASTINSKNSIIAGNTAPVGPDCFDMVNSQDYNLILNISDCTINGLTLNNIIGQDPRLDLLHDNGGSTETQALLLGSPAINAGSPDCPPPTIDQRGVIRPQGGYCDIGAYEAQPVLTLNKTIDQAHPVSGQLLTYTLTISNSGSLSATNTFISDTLPATLIFAGPVTLNPSQPEAILAQHTDDLPILASNLTITAGQIITLTFPVTISNNLADGTIITNTAAVTSAEVTTMVTGTVSVIVANNPGITLTKTANVSTAQVGQTITYTYRITNTGNVTLAGLSASDEPLGPISLGQATLAPGQSTSGSLAYTVIEADLPGPLTNTVTVTGTSPTGPVITASTRAAVALVEVGEPETKVHLPIIVKQN